MAKIKLNLPSITIVTPSYDGALDTLKKCLSIVRSQNYPQNKIKIILGHGGNEKIIKPIAKKFKAEYVLIPKDKQNAEYNRGIAFSKAKSELVLVLDHDNFMPTKNFLRQYVQPFLDNKNIVAVESCYYHYDPKFPLLDRYFALFGCLDPVPFYFGKNDRMMWTSDKWNLLGNAKDKGEYYEVRFAKDPRQIPTLGTNGCIMRTKIVKANANTKPGSHYPIDVMVDVIKNTNYSFGFTKNSITHLTSSRGIIPFLKRRLMFMKQYHFEDQSKRRYSVYMPGDLGKLFKYCIYSSTLVIPLIDSIRGYMKVRDIAWFVHPIMCIGIMFVYIYGTILGFYSQSTKRIV